MLGQAFPTNHVGTVGGDETIQIGQLLADSTRVVAVLVAIAVDKFSVETHGGG